MHHYHARTMPCVPAQEAMQGTTPVIVPRCTQEQTVRLVSDVILI